MNKKIGLNGFIQYENRSIFSGNKIIAGNDANGVNFVIRRMNGCVMIDIYDQAECGELFICKTLQFNFEQGQEFGNKITSFSEQEMSPF